MVLDSTEEESAAADAGGLPQYEEILVAGEISPCVPPPSSSPPTVHQQTTFPAMHVPSPNSPVATEDTSVHVKKKKKKDRHVHPQNVLLALAGGFSGGASPRGAVVDLRALEELPARADHRTHRGGSSIDQDVPPTQILDFLYLGSVKDAQNADFLDKHSIRWILNISTEEYWSVDKRVQIVTYKLDDAATADIASLFHPTRNLINSVRERYYRHKAAGRASAPAVLVHCQKGRSRSASIVLAYLIYMNGWSVAEAMKYVGTRRPCAEPNIGFMEELRKLQESMSTEERTTRYSELCWFMRNLDVNTTAAEVRELFEQRVGKVRHVVTMAAPHSHTAVTTSVAGGVDGAAAHTPLSSVTDAGAFPSVIVTQVPNEKPIVSLAEPAALCFVFLACREDILQGIKGGQLREVLRVLHPAPGKEIKYTTGPRLLRMILAHPSMSASFAQDRAQYSVK